MSFPKFSRMKYKTVQSVIHFIKSEPIVWGCFPVIFHLWKQTTHIKRILIFKEESSAQCFASSLKRTPTDINYLKDENKLSSWEQYCHLWRGKLSVKDYFKNISLFKYSALRYLWESNNSLLIKLQKWGIIALQSLWQMYQRTGLSIL